MLGVHVHIDDQIFNSDFGWAVLIAFLVSCVQPLLMMLLCWVSGLKSRTIVYTALLHNSMGEKSLVLLVIAEKAGVFGRDIFAVLVTATVLSLAMSAAFILFVENVLHFVTPAVGFMDNPSRDEIKREGTVKNRFCDHIMILGFNETGLEVAEFFRELSLDVVVCDLDPVLHEAFLFSYKGTGPKKGRRLKAKHSDHESFESLKPVSPDGVMVHGAHMGGPGFAESQGTLETSPANLQSSSAPEEAIVMTNSPMPQSRGGVGTDQPLLPSLSPSLVTNSEGQSPSGKADLSSLLLQFKLEKDAQDIKANGVSSTDDLLEIEPEMLPDLILTPIAKAKLKKLLRHVSAPGWYKPESLQFGAHMSPPASFRGGESVPPTLMGLPGARAGVGGGDVAFSSRTGIGAGGLAPRPPPRGESYVHSPTPAAQRSEQAGRIRVGDTLSYPRDKHVVAGDMHGAGTNIFPVYADPENRSTWERYNCKGATLVVSCMANRDNVSLCKYMSSSDVATMVVCTSNQEARELYEAGCTYCVQEDFLAAKEMGKILPEEFQSQNWFVDRAEDHKDDL